MSKPASPRRVGDKEALAVNTTIRGSAQKLNLVAALIRGRKVEDALNILTFSTKAMAVDARKVLASAIANAESCADLNRVFTFGCADREVDWQSLDPVARRAWFGRYRVVAPFHHLLTWSTTPATVGGGSDGLDSVGVDA